MTFLVACSFLIFADQMPELGRVLEFRPRTSAPLASRAEAVAAATEYLSCTTQERSERVEAVYGNADILMAVCGLLRNEVNQDPAGVLTEAQNIHSWVSS